MDLLPAYETWTWIAGYEGRFEVSNRGRIHSWVGKGGRSKKTKGVLRFIFSPVIKKIHPTKWGYWGTTIGNDCMSDVRRASVHREVALIYNKNPYPVIKNEVNHINGNKRCNEWWNFEWVTRLESIDHAFRTGLIKPALGEAQSNTKLTNDEVLQIFNSKMKTAYLSMLFGVSTHAILDIKKGRTWWHLTGKTRFIKPCEIGRFKKQ